MLTLLPTMAYGCADGVPLDNYCTETSPSSGIFTRKWSKAGLVEMNCNTYEAKIPNSGGRV